MPRSAFLLEAEPHVHYDAEAAVSAHHLEVLWVSADRPMKFIGRPDFDVPSDSMLPLSEYIWLTLPADTRVSAVHTPGALLAGKLWAALDRHNDQILQFAGGFQRKRRDEEQALRTTDRTSRTRIRRTIVGDLGSLLGYPRQSVRAELGHRSALQAAAAIVAESVGARLVDTRFPIEEGSLLDAVGPAVAPSGIRTRRIRLSPGWEGVTGHPFSERSPMRRRARWRSSTAGVVPSR